MVNDIDVTTNRTWRRFIAGVVLFALVIGLVLVTEHDRSTRTTSTLNPFRMATCHASQMTVSLILPKTPYSPDLGFDATVWYTNTGATCYVSPNNLMYEAVTGPKHTAIGSSVSGLVAYQSFILEHGRQAYADITIASISTPTFKQLVRTHGGSCTAKLADGIVLLGLGTNWPQKYFALPEKVPVCTTDYYNVVGNVIAKKLTPGETDQATIKAAVSTLQDFLNLWSVAGFAAATRQFHVPSSGAMDTFRLKSGTVTSWRQFAWTSSNRFTLLVSLDLHFTGSSGPWNEGGNGRYVTFIRSTSSGAWRMSINSGP